MAKTKGPLFSLEAHGSIGKVLTFQKGLGAGQVHIKTNPSDKRTAKQIKDRAVVSLTATEYSRESQTVKDLFDSLAPDKNIISGYNLYQKIFLLFYSDWTRFNKAKFKGAIFGGPENKLDKI